MNTNFEEGKKHRFLQIHAQDNVLVALQDLAKGEEIDFGGKSLVLSTAVESKHKFALEPFKRGDRIIMYGVLVGIANQDIAQGEAITVKNVDHASSDYVLGERKSHWDKPDTSAYEGKTFNGFHRADGSVGTRNFWLVIPLVFCENRNVNVLKEALDEKLGYKKVKSYENEVESLIALYKTGKSTEEILNTDLKATPNETTRTRLFPNVDGVKFITHDMGCGGIKLDADSLCGLIAGYITHPNVAGATILSLGCQHSEVSTLQNEIRKRDPQFSKPLTILEQQALGTETNLMQEALKRTFAGLVEANKNERKPAPISKICIGLECGGSDGFSGISANPALGYVSDILVSLGGSVVLSEFPELCGVEQELSDRCVDEETANRFMHLMSTYNARAV
ncbi:MAG: altronate hydrolase, partial [Sphingobacteriales bacterium 24-40-4]